MSRPAAPRACSVDLVVVSALGGELVVLLPPAAPGSRRARELPWVPARARLLPAARRLARRALGMRATGLEQVGAYDGGRHPSGTPLSVAFRLIVPAGAPAPGAAATWVPVSRLPALPSRQRAMVEDALGRLRGRAAGVPAAFQLLPDEFTLSELQQTYELLLGRPLHKASFRRALRAAALVRPGAEWRRTGRGRPAQLFRYAPARPRPAARGIALGTSGADLR